MPLSAFIAEDMNEYVRAHATYRFVIADEEEERRRQPGENGRTMSRPDWERTEPERKLCKALEEVQKQVGAKSIQAVAIAYVMQKTPFVFPIIGGRKVEHLHANIGALDVALTREHIKQIESVVPFDAGFPSNFIVRLFSLYPLVVHMLMILSRVRMRTRRIASSLG